MTIEQFPKMRDEDSDWWSGLQTVSSFDNGVTSPVTLEAGDEVQQFSPSSLLVESLIGQLCKLIEKNPRNQKQLYLKICKKLHQMKLIDETYEMEEFESMRSYYQKALYQMVCVAKTANNKAMDKKAVVTKPNSQQVCLKSDNILEWSRYSTEYEEMDFIARGGFGQVFRARHKLDGEIYAVKKIYLRYNNAAGFLQSLAEVKMLARLNHPNIVAYKAAWLEPIDPTQRKKHFFHDVSTCIIEPSTDIQDSSDSIVFESSDIKEDKTPDTSDTLAVVKPTDTLTDWNHSSLSNNNSSQEWACLYIQMQLCEVTLRQWLDRRNQNLEPVNEHQCLVLFKKIVQGVEYIHSQGIVHHDIKPSNIFVSADLAQVQVGDFGLACSLLTHNPEVAVIPSAHAHRGQVGTKLYAAPEQLNTVCTAKSDIFSLGIVLLELIQPFQTDMERSKVIGRLKTGHIPPELADSFPVLVRVINRCIFHSPNKRPTAHELLDMLEDADNSNSARIIAEKDEMIRRLHQEAFEREREIAELKRRLLELSGTPSGSFDSSSQESFTLSPQFL